MRRIKAAYLIVFLCAALLFVWLLHKPTHAQAAHQADSLKSRIISEVLGFTRRYDAYSFNRAISLGDPEKLKSALKRATVEVNPFKYPTTQAVTEPPEDAKPVHLVVLKDPAKLRGEHRRSYSRTLWHESMHIIEFQNNDPQYTYHLPTASNNRIEKAWDERHARLYEENMLAILDSLAVLENQAESPDAKVHLLNAKWRNLYERSQAAWNEYAKAYMDAIMGDPVAGLNRFYRFTGISMDIEKIREHYLKGSGPAKMKEAIEYTPGLLISYARVGKKRAVIRWSANGAYPLTLKFQPAASCKLCSALLVGLPSSSHTEAYFKVQATTFAGKPYDEFIAGRDQLINRLIDQQRLREQVLAGSLDASNIRFYVILKDANSAESPKLEIKGVFPSFLNLLKSGVSDVRRALNENNMLLTCTAMETLLKYKKAAPKEFARSAALLSLDVQEFSDKLKSVSTAMESEALAALSTARSAIDKCRTRQARSVLQKVPALLAQMWSIDEGKCGPSLESEILFVRHEALKNRLDAVKSPDVYNALIEDARNKAANHCAYDTAVTSRSEIFNAVKQACVPPEQARQDLDYIVKKAAHTGARAEKLEASLLKELQIALLYLNDSLDNPSCETEKAKEGFLSVRQKAQTLLCQSSPQPLSEGPARVRDNIEGKLLNAEKFIETQTEKINQAKRDYQAEYNALIELTEDPCKYSAAADWQSTKSLRELAADFCSLKQAETDIEFIKTTVNKMTKRIKTDMDALKKAHQDVRAGGDCQALEKLIHSAVSRTEWFSLCEDKQEAISSTVKEINDILINRRETAANKLRQSISIAEKAYSTCLEIDNALSGLRSDYENSETGCLDNKAINSYENVMARLSTLRDSLDRAYQVEGMLREHLQTAQAYLDINFADEAKERNRKKLYNEERAVLKDLVLSATGQPFTHCVKPLIDIVRGLPEIEEADTPSGSGGFSEEGQAAEDVSNAQAETGGFSEEGQDVSNAQAEAEGFSEEGQAAGEPDQDGFSETGQSGQAAENRDVSSVDYAEPVPAISEVDCLTLPGSVPYRDPLTGREGCVCPEGSVALSDGKGCENARSAYCRELSKRMSEAKDINLFRSLLAQSAGCPHYKAALEFLRNTKHCQKLDSALAQAAQRGDTNAFAQLTAQSTRCPFYQNALSHLNSMRNRDQQQQWQQMVSGFLNAWQQMNQPESVAAPGPAEQPPQHSAPQPADSPPMGLQPSEPPSRQQGRDPDEILGSWNIGRSGKQGSVTINRTGSEYTATISRRNRKFPSGTRYFRISWDSAKQRFRGVCLVDKNRKISYVFMISGSGGRTYRGLSVWPDNGWCKNLYR